MMFLLRIPLSPVELWCLTFFLQTWSGVQSHQGDWTISYKCEKNNVRRHNTHTSCFQVGVEHTTSCRGRKHDTKPLSVLVDTGQDTHLMSCVLPNKSLAAGVPETDTAIAGGADTDVTLPCMLAKREAGHQVLMAHELTWKNTQKRTLISLRLED